MIKKRVLTKEIAERFSMIQELKKLERVLKDLKFLNPERDLLRFFDLREFLLEDAGDPISLRGIGFRKMIGYRMNFMIYSAKLSRK